MILRRHIENHKKKSGRIKRATYQAYIWLHADQAYSDVPSPEGHGWKLADGNSIDYEWTSGCIFPEELVDIMCSGDTAVASDSQDDDDAEQSIEVDMIDAVYEDESDDEVNY